MARPIIALLTDFGSQDHYVGTMKGVVLGICPEASIVDISHEVPPHDVREASLQLTASYRFFPAATVFLVVVDPGVGSSRRGLAVEAGDYRFVAPDNGVLTGVVDELPPKRVVEITERRYARPTVTRTFEGRDRFAPAAAWLAKGIQLSALGRPVSAPQRIDLPVPVVESDRVEGEILRVDRFGNLVSNVDRKVVERFAEAGSISIEAGGHPVGRLVATYSEMGDAEIGALYGSTDQLEISAYADSAAARLKLGRGARIVIRRE